MPMLLSVSVGTGVQTLTMSVITMAFAVLGFLSPANRGGLLTATLLLFVLMGVPAGYFSAHTYKSVKGTEWKKATLMTALLWPGVVVGAFFVLNFFIWGQASSGAMPLGTMLALLLMWFGISTPLVFVGAFFGFKAKLADPPTRTNEIPRQIPAQAWYMGPMFNILMGGILPFGAIFIELFFIMTSVWLQRFYYVFGFLALVLLILVITCSEIAVVPATSSSATRTTSGGGAPSSRRARRASTSSPTRSCTFSPSSTSSASCPHSSTSPTCSSLPCSSSSSSSLAPSSCEMP